jgi:three-Cys-motif partner protein
MHAIDEIGPWSEVKLDIISKYATAYSTILSRQSKPTFYHVYVDGFAGAGANIARCSSKPVLGSALRALNIDPPFHEYHFVDSDRAKTDILRQLMTELPNSGRASIHHGDCSQILIENVLPRVRFDDYRRALCLLDPYGMHWKWEVIRLASEMRSIEVFLNFPVMDINRNILRKNQTPAALARFTSFWGDDSWRETLYRKEKQTNLFGTEESIKVSSERIAEAFRSRLKSVAGFGHVSKPLPMRNSRGATLYHLIFASHKPVAERIVSEIFKKYNR